MNTPTIFDTCRPRPDVLAGVADADFAADLATVVSGQGSAAYSDPARFFANTALLPAGPVRVAAFDGENADPANGRKMGNGVRAHTPWGEFAFAWAAHRNDLQPEAAQEEAAYWLGMAMHRRNPRRVQKALRALLTGPRGSGD